ncbi:BREX-1 system adenine-specific DNA-methyltransferase PglX [Methylobacter psychrophilus]|uniref:BREX-1 system adenine-specific DNA-methyltransferase PglX n=1 Tax=Methylobacter psychrophilus TaxID=96941 RepID=UPI0021D4B792|nr:BREX-1 system adenine-specific DNA-methyltransferase PglX [Methylobacter psychrophilus]
MNTNNIKKYAPQARCEFIEAIGKRLNQFGIYADGKSLRISEPTFFGSVMQIDGNAFDATLASARKRLVLRAEQLGFAALIEQVAYTWFNRLCAIRFMELKTDYLEHGFRVLSHPEKGNSFEILDHAQDAAEALGLDRDFIVELKLAGNKDEELYRYLLLGQCHQLHQAMPFLFEALDDETELLLPDNLTRTDSILRGLVDGIPEEDWEQVEIIGWLYQFYISEKKDQVIGKVVKSEDIPAATQLFTPNWIVKYLVQNSVGRQWMMTYPDSSLKSQMEYYIEPAEQEAAVTAALAALTPISIEPETIKVIDPACGSGHILVEAYNLLKAIYEERGYRSRDIPKLILENNLFGLDIDDRAAQLAGFALMMKAREDDWRIFTRDIKLNVLALQSTQDLNLPDLWRKLDLNNVMQVGTTESIFDDAQSNLIDVVDDVDYTALESVLVLFEHAKTFGSLIQVPHDKAEFLHDLKNQLEPLIEQGDNYKKMAARVLLPFVEQACVLAQRYDAVVANPPYMGGKGMNPELKVFAQKHFPDSKSDLFAMFMERAFYLLNDRGYNAQVNMQSWMFLSSYQAMREKLLDTHTFITMAHLGARAFGQISGEVVQTTAFVLAKKPISTYRPTFFRLIEGNEEVKRLALLKKENTYNQIQQEDFNKIPGSPIAYWVSDKFLDIFENSKLNSIFFPYAGITTGCNEKYLRLWHEIPINIFDRNLEVGVIPSNKTYVPHMKGGDFRRWYGNGEYCLSFSEEALRKMKEEKGFRPDGIKNFFNPMLSWSYIGSGKFSARSVFGGASFDTTGTCGFSEYNLEDISGLLNSKVAQLILDILNPTLTYLPRDIKAIPYIPIHSAFIKDCIKISRSDWDSYETSWDFKKNPLIVGWVSDSACASEGVTQQTDATNVGLRDKAANPTYNLPTIYADWQTQNRQTIAEMQRLEQENNRLFIDAYGLQDELDADVLLEQITLTINPKYRYGGNLNDEQLAQRFQSDTLAELISYSIGCMMGRYRLDKSGLIYAHSGNIDFDQIYNAVGADSSATGRINSPLQFAPDDDGIIPLTDQEWFKDDATNRFRDFVRTVWGEDNLQTNLDFVAESLCLSGITAKRGEQSLETIRRYLCNQFYKNHLKTYKKRPIYWLFSSGKQKGFECLVYLHRYNESTLSRMRTEYVTPLLGKYDSFAMQLNKQMEDASTTEATRLKKDLIALEKKQTELRAFDDKLKHYADRRIKLDLDDGVKVNYGKFGDLLAEVKAVTGGKE